MESDLRDGERVEDARDEVGRSSRHHEPSVAQFSAASKRSRLATDGLNIVSMPRAERTATTLTQNLSYPTREI